MRRFVIGDIHGRFEALKEVLKKAKFDYSQDKLIVLGDVVDGGYNIYEVVEELLKIKNLIMIMGNHDEFFLNHLKSGWAEEIWIQQGGANTLRSYGATVREANYISDNSKINTKDLNVPVTHQEFFNKAKYYHIENDMLFVHGGYDPKLGVEATDRHTLVWDRELINRCRNGLKITKYKKVFIGHTTTQTYANDPKVKNSTEPIKFGKLIMMDCGAGWHGRLAIMNIDTEKYWLSSWQEPAVR